MINCVASNFLSISNMSSISKNTAANDIRDIPKCAAKTKLDCPHLTAAAPIKPCKIRKKVDNTARNLTSRTWPRNFHDKIDKASTVTPIIEIGRASCRERAQSRGNAATIPPGKRGRNDSQRTKERSEGKCS